MLCDGNAIVHEKLCKIAAMILQDKVHCFVFRDFFCLIFKKIIYTECRFAQVDERLEREEMLAAAVFQQQQIEAAAS